MVDFNAKISGFFNKIEDNFGKSDNEKTSMKDVKTEELQEIFDTALKDGEASTVVVANLFGNAFLNGKNSQVSMEDLDTEYVKIFNELAGMDGTDTSFSQAEIDVIMDYYADPAQAAEDFNKKADGILNSEKAQLAKLLGSEVISTDDNKVKYDDDGSAYVEVEAWSHDSGKNDCLKRIISNNYDLEKMGIEPYSKEYQALEKAIMDANPEIYGDENGEGGRDYLSGYDGQRNSKIIRPGDKLILPGLQVEKEDDKDNKAIGGPEPTISEEDAKNYATQLYNGMDGWGTNEQAVKSILLSEDLSPSDMALIIKEFNGQYGSLVDKIHNDFSGEAENELLNAIAKNLSEACDAGDEEAIKLICDEIYNATEARMGTTDQWLEAVFNNSSQSTLKAIKDNYSKFNNETNIFTALHNDFKWDIDKYNKYAELLNNADKN